MSLKNAGLQKAKIGWHPRGGKIYSGKTVKERGRERSKRVLLERGAARSEKEGQGNNSRILLK